MLKLEYLDQTQSVWLIGPSMRVGSKRGSELFLLGDGIAAEHAEFLIDDRQVVLKPIEKNVCLVNGCEIDKPYRLTVGDILGIGAKEFTLVDPKEDHDTSVTRGTKESQREGNKNSASAAIKYRSDPKPEPVTTDWYLQSKHKNFQHKRYPLDGIVQVGRSQSCELSFSLDRLSRKHAQIRVVDACLEITDLNSSNGTFVNGERVTQTQAYPGDEISFDRLAFTVCGPDSAARQGTAVQDKPDDLNRTVIRPALTSAALKRNAVQAPAATEEPRAETQKDLPKGAGRSGSRLLVASALLVLAVVGLMYFLPGLPF